ncbi:unnamed protein product, partial [marine sediment metagenome]
NIFYRNISSKFDRYSNDNNSVRIEVIPYYNIELIDERCEDNNIVVIPIDYQLLLDDVLLK